MTEIQLKLAFAAQLLKIGKNPNEAFKAALVIFPDDTSLALKAATQWLEDPIVVAEKERLLAEGGEESELPTKIELLKEIHERAKACMFSEDYARLMRLYMEMRGMINKPQPSTNNNTVVQNTVMIVKDHGSDEDWKAGIRAQQARLINASASA